MIHFFETDIREEDIRSVTETLRRGWISTGEITASLERLIARMCASSGALCLNSCTSALELALRVLGVGPGDEVILPAYTYTATAAAVLHVGALPVLADSAPGSCAIDPLCVERLFSKRTKAVMPVDIGGVICDLDSIRGICGEKSSLFQDSPDSVLRLQRAAIIADSAHGLGGIRNGSPSGSLADLSCFSFHSVKNATCADGGALTWRVDSEREGKELEKRLRLLSLHGQTRSSIDKRSGRDWEYDILLPGYKCNMTDFAASLLLPQLRRYDTILDRRRQLIRYYDERLSGLPITVLPHLDNSSPSAAHLYMTFLPPTEDNRRDRLYAEMLERGVACNVHFKPLPLLTAYRRIFSPADCPNAIDLFRRELSLPLHTRLSDAEVECVADAFVSSFKKVYG